MEMKTWAQRYSRYKGQSSLCFKLLNISCLSPEKILRHPEVDLQRWVWSVSGRSPRRCSAFLLLQVGFSSHQKTKV